MGSDGSRSMCDAGFGAERVSRRENVQNGKDRHVFVIEDEVNISEAIRFILERDHWQVEVFGNATSALAALDVTIPNLIVLDLMLPDIHGFDVLSRLKVSEKTRDIPVILLSARGQADTRNRAIEGGAAMFIAKPFANADLLAAARQLVTV